MAYRKIILLLSILFVSGSSYIFISYKKNNYYNKVNLANSQDDSIDYANEEESINEDDEVAESSSSFLKYFFLFIIIVIIVIIVFLVIKKIVDKKQEIKTAIDNKTSETVIISPLIDKNNKEENKNPNPIKNKIDLKNIINNTDNKNTDNKNNTEESIDPNITNNINNENIYRKKNKEKHEKNNFIKFKFPKLKINNENPKEFNEYIEERTKKILEKIEIDVENINDLTDGIIQGIKQDYDDYLQEQENKDNNINSKNNNQNRYYILDFYYEKIHRNEKDNIIKTNKEHNYIFNVKGKKVCDINSFQNKNIIKKLFMTLFHEIEENNEFQNFNCNENIDEEKEEKIIKNIFFFIITVIEPFLKCVSERKEKDVWFISGSDELLAHGFFLMAVEQDKSIEKIYDFTQFLMQSKKCMNYFKNVVDQLINFYFKKPGFFFKLFQ